jgi:hypothetical protein
MESGLIFNQLICEFESRHPCQLWANAERDYISKNDSSRSIPCRPSVWVVAQLAEHRTVTAAREGSTPFGPPNSTIKRMNDHHQHLKRRKTAMT